MSSSSGSAVRISAVKSIFSNTDTDTQSQTLTGHGQPHQQPHGGDDGGGGDEGEVRDGIQEELVQPWA